MTESLQNKRALWLLLPVLPVIVLCALWIGGVFNASNKDSPDPHVKHLSPTEQQQSPGDDGGHTQLSPKALSKNSSDDILNRKALDAYIAKTIPCMDNARIPKEFGAFFSLSGIRQARLVTEAMQNPSLNRETRQFFLVSLKDNRLSRLVRNNMAEALKNQEDKDPQLYRAFLDIINDDSQNSDWRLYSIQHLAAVYPWSDCKDEIENKLFGLLDNAEEEFSSQAMLMIDDLAIAGQVKLREGFLDLIEKNLSRSSSTPTRISAMTLLRWDYAAEKKEIVRKHAAKQSPIQRVAIANLGLIGDSADLKMLSSFLNDRDSRVALAARKALERLK